MSVTDAATPFDRALKFSRGPTKPTEIDEAATFVNDTLRLCWASAQTVFGDKATPELALAIYDRVIAQREDDLLARDIEDDIPF